MAMIEDGFMQLLSIADAVEMNTLILFTYRNIFDREKQLFYSSQLFDVYPELNHELYKVHGQIEVQALTLANFYRDK